MKLTNQKVRRRKMDTKNLSATGDSCRHTNLVAVGGTNETMRINKAHPSNITDNWFGPTTTSRLR